MKLSSSAQMPLRSPISPHEALQAGCESEGVSLNQYCLYILSRYAANDQAISQKRGEELLQFLAQAQALQKELVGEKQVSKPQPFSLKKRWRKIHGKN